MEMSDGSTTHSEDMPRVKEKTRTDGKKGGPSKSSRTQTNKWQTLLTDTKARWHSEVMPSGDMQDGPEEWVTSAEIGIDVFKQKDPKTSKTGKFSTGSWKSRDMVWDLLSEQGEDGTMETGTDGIVIIGAKSTEA